MSLVLDLPQTLDSQIHREALKHGMSPQAYATQLLQFATKFVDENTESFVLTFDIAKDQTTLKTSEPQHQSAFGRYAHVASSSDAFALEKQREINYEEGKSFVIYVLDACAMIAYLKGELGGTVVDTFLRDASSTCYAHSYNLCEVYYNFVRGADEKTARQAISDLLNDGVIERKDMNRTFWQRAGRLKARGGISLPDCFCIALAQTISGTVVTSDHHEFDPLVPLGFCPIYFIR